MNITYRLTLNEYQEAVYFHYKTGKRPLFIAVFAGMATFMMMVGTDYTNTREVIDNILITFFALAFYLLFARMITSYQAKKTYNKSPILSKEITLRVSGKGITHDKKNNNEIIPWDTFSTWKANDKYYLVYTSSYQFNVIPKHAMNEAQQEELEGYFNKYLR